MLTDFLNKPYSGHVSSGKFSISSIDSCLRKKYLQMKGLFKEDFDEKAKRIFKIGDVVHQEIMSELIAKGENNSLHVTAMEIDIIHPFLSGRIDAILSDGKELFILDVKSAGQWTLDKIQEGNCPQNYQDQVLLYMHITGIHKGLLLFVGKNKGELIEYPVEYNKDRAEFLIREVETFMKENVEKGIEPQPCNKDISPFGCPVCSPK